jgi:hypothetical protein
LRTVLACVVVLATAVVPVVIDQVVVVLGLLQANLVTANTVPILLLVLQVLVSTLLMKVPVTLLLKVLPGLPA